MVADLLDITTTDYRNNSSFTTGILKNYQELFTHLDQEPQVDILALGFLPVDLAVLVVPDVNSLLRETVGLLVKMVCYFTCQRGKR